MQHETSPEQTFVVDDMVEVRCVANVEPKPVRWLWPGRMARGKLSLIAGNPGLGKSQLTIALVATVTTGGKWPVDCATCEPGSMLMLSAEDDVADTRVAPHDALRLVGWLVREEPFPRGLRNGVFLSARGPRVKLLEQGELAVEPGGAQIGAFEIRKARGLVVEPVNFRHRFQPSG